MVQVEVFFDSIRFIFLSLCVRVRICKDHADNTFVLVFNISLKNS